jgi:hypothetical protein
MHAQTFARVDQFVMTRLVAGSDGIQINALGVSFNRIKRDLRYLEITSADYRLAHSDLVAAHTALYEREANRPTGPRRLTAGEVEQNERRSRVAHVAHLRIETLYFVGHRLLDNVVAAVDAVLSPTDGKPRGEKNLGRHRTVTPRLLRRVETGLAPATAGLPSLPDRGGDRPGEGLPR